MTTQQLSGTTAIVTYDTSIAKQPPRNAWTLALAGLGAFMAALDVVVVSTALPTLQAHPRSAGAAPRSPARWRPGQR